MENKKKKKGFTLIELLAIIVILAIIAVITIPIILNIIDESKKGAAKDSAYGYKDAINKYYLNKLYDDSNYTIPNDIYTVNAQTGYLVGTETLEIQVSGKFPNAGGIKLAYNEIEKGCLQFDEYAVPIINDEVGEAIKGTCNGINLVPASDIEVPTLEIGSTIYYTTTLNDVTLDDWKVFYIDGDYTYLIYGDYLPNAAVSNTIKTNYNLVKSGLVDSYEIWTEANRANLINAMATKSNWDDLLTGTIKGHTLNETRTENIWAMGAPTLDLWVESWNTSYPNNVLYTRYIDTQDVDNNNFYATGYTIGKSEETIEGSVSLYGMDGYANKLYFPDSGGELYKAEGYWLASPSASEHESCVMNVTMYGSVDYGSWMHERYYHNSFRPVIKLPTSVVEQGLTAPTATTTTTTTTTSE